MKHINPHRLFHGIWTPEWLDSRPEISDGAKRLYAQLCRFAGNKGEAFPSYQTLATRLQKSRRQTIRLIEELCNYKLINITYVKDKVRGNRTNIYRFLWHPWMQLAEDENYSLIKVDFGRHPSDINVTTPGDTRVTSPSDINVTQKRVIYKERGKEDKKLLTDQLPPPQQVLKSEKAIPERLSKASSVDNDTDPWKSAKDAVENFKNQKLYPREWEKIISEIHKLSLCAIGEEALALKWYGKAAKAASLGLTLPTQQRQPLDALPSQEKATVVLAEQPKIEKPIPEPLTEEKWAAMAGLLKAQIPDEPYQRWFGGIVPIQLKGNSLFLAMPNQVYQNWIETNYQNEMEAVSEKLKVKIFYQTYETANGERAQGKVGLCAQSALCLRSFERLLAKCSFTRLKAGFKQPFWTARLAWGKRLLCTGKANHRPGTGTSLCPLLPFLTKPSSTWNVSWFVSTQDSKIVDNFAPSHFLFNFFTKTGRLFRSSSELQRKEIKQIYANT